MKRRFALLLSIVAVSFGGAAVAPTTDSVSLSPSAAAKACSSGYRHAVVGGVHKCLRRGQYCAIGSERQYHRYGYHCHRSSRDSRGSYHLT